VVGTTSKRLSHSLPPERVSFLSGGLREDAEQWISIQEEEEEECGKTLYPFIHTSLLHILLGGSNENSPDS
jgi:hypothetical protein